MDREGADRAEWWLSEGHEREGVLPCGERRRDSVDDVGEVEDEREREARPHDRVAEERRDPARTRLGIRDLQGELHEREGELLLLHPWPVHQHHQAHHGEPQGNEEAQPRQQRAHPDPPRDRSAAQCLVNPADGVRIAHRGPIGKVLLRFIQLVARLVEVERGGHQSDEKARHTAAERHRGDADKEEDEEHFPTTETAIRPGGVGKQSVGKKHDQDRRDCGDRGYALRDVDPESHDLRLPDPEPGYDRQEESREEGPGGYRAATSGAIGLTRLLPFVHWVAHRMLGHGHQHAILSTSSPK